MDSGRQLLPSPSEWDWVGLTCTDRPLYDFLNPNVGGGTSQRARASGGTGMWGYLSELAPSTWRSGFGSFSVVVPAVPDCPVAARFWRYVENEPNPVLGTSAVLSGFYWKPAMCMATLSGRSPLRKPPVMLDGRMSPQFEPFQPKADSKYPCCRPLGVAFFADGLAAFTIPAENATKRTLSDGGVVAVAGTDAALVSLSDFGSLGRESTASATQLNYPTRLAISPVDDALFIADTSSNAVRRVLRGQLSTVAGNPQCFPEVCPAQTAKPPFQRVECRPEANANKDGCLKRGCCWAPQDGSEYQPWCFFGPRAVVSIGQEKEGRAAPAAQACVRAPQGLALDGRGALVVAEPFRLRRVLLANNSITTLSTFYFVASGVAVDPISGAVFVADVDAQVIQRLLPGSALEVVAGVKGAAPGWGGDGAALSVRLNWPYDIAWDASTTTLLIADKDNHAVRRLNFTAPSGAAPPAAVVTILGVPGGSVYGYNGDSRAPLATSLWQPAGLAVDGKGRILVADSSNFRVRLFTPSTRETATLAQSGPSYSGDGGPVEAANIYQPKSLALDNLTDTVFFCDQYNNRVRVIKPNSLVIDLLAGNGVFGSEGDGGPAAQASLNQPWGVAVGRGNVYITEYQGARVRRVDLSTGIISRFAGTGERTPNGQAGVDDGKLAVQARLTMPHGITVSSATGLVFFVDLSDGGDLNTRVKMVRLDGILTTMRATAGENSQYMRQKALGVLVDDARQRLLIACTWAHRVLSLDLKNPDAELVVIAGSGAPCPWHGLTADDGGFATSATLCGPHNVALGPDGIYFVDTWNGRVAMIDETSGKLFTVAGYASNREFDGDVSPDARRGAFNEPQGLGFDSGGNLIISDTYNNRLRTVVTGKLRCPPGSYCPCGLKPLPCAAHPSIFCPANSAAPLNVTPGFFAVAAIAPRGNPAFTSQAPCPPGFYCSGGVRTPCPAGRFGRAAAQPAVASCEACARGRYLPSVGVSVAGVDAPTPCLLAWCPAPLLPVTNGSGAAAFACQGCALGTAPGPNSSCVPCAAGSQCLGFLSAPLIDLGGGGGAAAQRRARAAASGVGAPSAVAAPWPACPRLTSAPPPSDIVAVPNPFAPLLRGLGVGSVDDTLAVSYFPWVLFAGFALLLFLFALLVRFKTQWKCPVRPFLALDKLGRESFPEKVPLGGLVTLLAYSFILACLANLVLQFRYENTRFTQALLFLDPDSVWPAVAAGTVFESARIPGALASEPPVRGLSLRVIASGEPGACAAPLSWSAAPAPVFGSWSVVSTPACGASAASQTVFFCASCGLGESRLTATFHFSCQSMLVSLGAVTAQGALVAASLPLNDTAGSMERGLLSSVSWTVAPMLTVDNNTMTGEVRSGYFFSYESSESTFSAPTTDPLSGAVVVDTSNANVRVVLDLKVAGFFENTVTASKSSTMDMVSAAVGLAGFTEVWAFAVPAYFSIMLSLAACMRRCRGGKDREDSTSGDNSGSGSESEGGEVPKGEVAGTRRRRKKINAGRGKKVAPLESAMVAARSLGAALFGAVPRDEPAPASGGEGGGGVGTAAPAATPPASPLQLREMPRPPSPRVVPEPTPSHGGAPAPPQAPPPRADPAPVQGAPHDSPRGGPPESGTKEVDPMEDSLLQLVNSRGGSLP